MEYIINRCEHTDEFIDETIRFKDSRKLAIIRIALAEMKEGASGELAEELTEIIDTLNEEVNDIV